MGATMSYIALWLLGVPTKEEKIAARRRINQRRRLMQAAAIKKNRLEMAAMPREPIPTKVNPVQLPTGLAFRKALQETREEAVRHIFHSTTWICAY